MFNQFAPQLGRHSSKSSDNEIKNIYKEWVTLSKSQTPINLTKETQEKYINALCSGQIRIVQWQKIYKDNFSLMNYLITHEQNQKLSTFLLKYPVQLHDIALHTPQHFQLVKQITQFNNNCPPRLKEFLEQDETMGTNYTKGYIL